MSTKKWYPSQIQMAIEAVGPHRMRTKRLQKKIRSHPDRYYMWNQKRIAGKLTIKSVGRIMQFRYATELLQDNIFSNGPLLKRIKKHDSWKGVNIEVPLRYQPNKD